MENTNSAQETQSETGSNSSWIFSILSIPKIGGLIATIIVLAPASLFSLLFIGLLPVDDSSLPGTPMMIIAVVILGCMLIATWWWLHYLERKVNLAFYLPIPLINIRLKWVLYPFMLPFFGIRRIYSALTGKASKVN